ncbi:hypothetical protein KM043_001404 [Ampulex compressa]|nr:hypothetical protein KM043_001404 [Ampulex compressa]
MARRAQKRLSMGKNPEMSDEIRFDSGQGGIVRNNRAGRVAVGAEWKAARAGSGGTAVGTSIALRRGWRVVVRQFPPLPRDPPDNYSFFFSSADKEGSAGGLGGGRRRRRGKERTSPSRWIASRTTCRIPSSGFARNHAHWIE